MVFEILEGYLGLSVYNESTWKLDFSSFLNKLFINILKNYYFVGNLKYIKKVKMRMFFSHFDFFSWFIQA